MWEKREAAGNVDEEKLLSQSVFISNQALNPRVTYLALHGGYQVTWSCIVRGGAARTFASDIDDDPNHGCPSTVNR